uniref:Uncharacterized protein n=1 Tax=Dictyoglomus turgidum TaxID=513050 RepID=A0A7C3SNK4_9BACT
MAIIKIKEGYEIKPEGLYVLRVNKIDVRTSERGVTAGSQFLVWEDIIVESPDHPELVGDTFTHSTPAGCSPKSKYYKVFQSVGMSIPEGQKEIEFDTDELIGKEFVADVIVVKVNDQERNDFKNVWSIEEFQEQQRKATQIFNKKLGGVSKETWGRISAQSSPNSTTSDNKDTKPSSDKKSVFNFPV